MTTYGALSAFPNPHRSASVAASRPDAVWADVARPGRTEDESPYSLVDLLRARQAWMDEARCTGRSEVTWFPGPHQSAKPARAVCKACAVREA